MESVTDPQTLQDYPPQVSSPATHSSHPSPASARAESRLKGNLERADELVELLGESGKKIRTAEAIRQMAWCMVVRELYRRSSLGESKGAIARIRHGYLAAFNKRPYASFWISWYERLEAAYQPDPDNTNRKGGKPYC